MRYATIAGLALALGGCSSLGDIPTVQPVNLVGSDFCKIVPEKLTWDVKDTRATITGIRRFNAKHDARCLRGKPVS